jgi:hypothetical protein
MLGAIIFTSNKHSGLVDIGHWRMEGNTIIGRKV